MINSVSKLVKNAKESCRRRQVRLQDVPGILTYSRDEFLKGTTSGMGAIGFGRWNSSKFFLLGLAPGMADSKYDMGSNDKAWGIQIHFTCQIYPLYLPLHPQRYTGQTRPALT